MALAEHLALWPLVTLVDRYHPRRGELTKLKGNRAAFGRPPSATPSSALVARRARAAS